MEQSDVQLIHRILQGDQDAFSPLVQEISEGGSRAGMAEDR